MLAVGEVSTAIAPVTPVHPPTRSRDPIAHRVVESSNKPELDTRGPTRERPPPEVVQLVQGSAKSLTEIIRRAPHNPSTPEIADSTETGRNVDVVA